MDNIYAGPKSDLGSDSGLEENTSGKGKYPDLPAGIAGWSWGAFILNWIWSLSNKTYIGLFALIPYVGFIMAIILGINGREWAWRNKKWDSVEHFNRVQKRWSVWAVCLVLIPIFGIFAAVVIPLFLNHK